LIINKQFYYLNSRYIKSIQDPYSKERWIELKNCLLSEFQIIKDISMELGSFKFSSNKNVTIVSIYLSRCICYVHVFFFYILNYK